MAGKGFDRFWRAFAQTALLWAHSTQLLLLLPVLALRRLWRKTARPLLRWLFPRLRNAGLFLARVLGLDASARRQSPAPKPPALARDQFEHEPSALPPPLTFSAEDAALLTLRRRLPEGSAAATPPTPTPWPQRMMRRLRRASRRNTSSASFATPPAPTARPEKPVQSTPLVTPSQRIQPFKQ